VECGLKLEVGSMIESPTHSVSNGFSSSSSVFEKEEDNVYVEPLLERQLETWVVAESCLQVAQQNQKVESVLESMLKSVIITGRKSNYLGGATYDPKTYIELQNCILKYMNTGVVVSSSLRDACSETLRSSNSLHPSIRRALNILLESSLTEGLTLKDIKEICFLAN